MAKFAKGVDHLLPNVNGEKVECVEGCDIPKDKLDWFRRYKPGWIAGGSKAITEAPEDKAIKPMHTRRK